MIISGADIRLAATHDLQTEHSVRERLSVWNGDGGLDYQRDEQSSEAIRERALLRNSLGVRAHRGLHLGRQGLAPGQGRDRADISPQAERLQASKRQAPLDEQRFTANHELEVQIIREMVKRLTGREFDLIDPADFAAGAGQEEAQQAAGAAPGGGGAGPAGEGWGVAYDHYESYRETEKTSFRAEGVIRTADGAEVAFSVDLHMSRAFFTESTTSIRMGDAPRMKDPLVVNFAGSAAELTRTRFAFDLDADGADEQVAFVRPGSGFLAWDRNGNGRVDDGSELFGATSGEGFAELASHDDDGNGWIDSGDTIYAGLRIWSRDAGGDDQLIGLGQRGGGAIYLGHVTTPFEVRDERNALQGAVRETGLFVAASGAVGTLQQLDLVV